MSTPVSLTTLLLSGTRSQYGIQVDNLGNAVVKNTSSGQTTTGSAVGEIQFSDIGVYVLNPAEANVARLYQAALGREPDAPGLSGWINIFYTESTTAQGSDNFTSLAETPVSSLPNLAYGFTQSSEFQQKYGSLTDTGFVTQLYQNVLSRAPDTAGLNGWLGLMQNGDANGVHYTREMVLVGFAESPENVAKTAAAATSSNAGGWLVDTSKGYADAGTLNAQTALAQASTTHSLDTSLIDLTTFVNNGSNVETSAGFTIHAPGSGLPWSANTSFGSPDGQTLVLSAQVPDGSTANNNDTIVGAPNGGSAIQIGAALDQAVSGNSVVLHGTGNSVTILFEGFGSGAGTAPTSSNTTITGYVPGSDSLGLAAIQSLVTSGNGPSSTHLPVQILTPSTPVSGASLQFTQNAYVLDVGTVGAGDAASVAAAANHLYTTADVNGNPNASLALGAAGAAGENLTILGETSSGNAVIYQWAKFGATASSFIAPISTADTNANHQIDAAELTLLVTLVGVNANSLTAADFH